MIEPHEVPIGWGLLEIDSAEAIDLRVLPTRFGQVSPAEWLVRIGRASTAALRRSILAGRNSFQMSQA
jgi:hypothetical protein